MTQRHVIDRRRYLTFPPAEAPVGRVRRAFQHIFGLAALPWILGASRLRSGPGLAARLACMRLGLRAVARGDRKVGQELLVFPMDSFRYFELAYVRAHVPAAMAINRYLDVSSPRLVPLMLLDARPDLTGDLINPIESDLRDTERMAAALNLAQRACAHSVLLEDTDYLDGTFDLITSISVVEHIPDDHAAIATMWRLLKPGGTLILTVPCAREAVEEYTNLDEYQLFDGTGDGFVYWQRYYDTAALAARIWSVTGPPVDMTVFGERSPGSYDRNVVRKRSFANYPYWNEPLMMARDYQAHDSIDALPGMGVVGMTFVKPESATP